MPILVSVLSVFVAVCADEFEGNEGRATWRTPVVLRERGMGELTFGVANEECTFWYVRQSTNVASGGSGRLVSWFGYVIAGS